MGNGLMPTGMLLIVLTSLMCGAREQQVYPYAQQFGDWAYEFLRINQYFFSHDSARIATLFAPAYLVGRSVDHSVHTWTYDDQHHLNTCQARRQIEWLCDEWGEIIPLVGLSSLAFIHPDVKVRVSSRMYMLGAISASWVNKLTKNMIEREWTRRPLNGDFPRRHVHGGFPSGHAAILTFTWVYWGLEYGPKAMVPLALYGLTTSCLLVQCNRHFVSQVIAGMALGTAYAFAAHKASIWRMEHLDISCGMTAGCKPFLGAVFRF